MGCCRITFGLTLVLRAVFHLLVAALAVRDLKDLYDMTSGTLTHLAMKLSHADVVVAEVQTPLGFYVFCGVGLFVLCCVYPWRGTSRSNMTVYAILHAMYVGVVVYVVFIRGIIDLSFFRQEYKIMSEPGLFPASLVMDVFTFLAAMVSSGKGDGVSYTSIFPLHRVMVISQSVRGVAPPAAGGLPPYTQFQNPTESLPRVGAKQPSLA